jgi:hypothetical protein
VSKAVEFRSAKSFVAVGEREAKLRPKSTWFRRGGNCPITPFTGTLLVTSGISTSL